MIIEINMQSPTTICDQLREQIIFGIAAGRLEPGEPLPSVRNLAADLGINYHTVNKAYSALCDEGYIIMDRRKGAVVAQNAQRGDEFISGISKTVLLAAAESACRGISEVDFIKICAGCYRQAKGERL
jgi:DNA-binding transcriptional regulator YhcF (GntR family)